MAVVPSDLALQWSTDFMTLFLAEYNQSIAVEQSRLAPLIQEIPLGNNEGNTVQFDWLGAAPQMVAWEDEKKSQSALANKWSATVARFHATMDVDIDAMMDAKFNPYEAKLREMSQNAARLRYNQISKLIRNGAAQKCYDGQNFFDTAHNQGLSGAQSNKLTGTGVTAAALKADYYSAYSALAGFLDDQGQPMGATDFTPLVWIPNSASLFQQFQDLQAAALISNTSNVLANRFKLIVDPTLTDPNDWFMFRVDTPTKPFFVVEREAAHYVDNFAAAVGRGASVYSDEVFNKRIGKASVEARMVATYGMWQKAVQVVN